MSGMGVDSGLPDYRGPEGFWKNYPPLKRLGISLGMSPFAFPPPLAFAIYNPA